MKAFVLAGGKSSRMNQDKGLIKIGNTTLIEHIVSQLQLIFNEVIVVTQKEEYKELGLTTILDIHPNNGPLAGIHAALKYSKEDIMVFTCDQPEIDKKLTNWIIDKQLCASINNNPIPFPGYYCFDDLKEIEERIINQELSVINFIKEVKQTSNYPYNYKRVDLNTPQELENYLESLS